MRKFLSLMLLTGLAAAQSGPFTTFDCAIYGQQVELDKNTRVDVWTEAPGVKMGEGVQVNPDGSVRVNSSDNPVVNVEGLVQQGSSRILPAVEPSHLSPSGPSHRLEKSQELRLKPGSYGTLEARNSARILLAPGEYRIENLELHNSADFDLEGPVVLCIGKSLTVRNSAELNGHGKPSELVVYQAEPNRPINVLVANSAMARMALCGPRANVKIANNGGVYGSLIAEQVQLGQQAQVHYDPGLKTVKLRR